MLKVEICPPNPTETLEQICEHNLRQADIHYHLAHFIASSMAWFKLRPGATYQDLETYLRGGKFNTYLIARKYDVMPTGTKFVRPPGMRSDTPVQFECIYSCRPAPHALNELIEVNETYEENFLKLGSAGMLGVDDLNGLNTNSIPGDSLKKFNSIESNTAADISDCKVKTRFVELAVEDFVSDLTISCREKYQADPTSKLIGMGPNGQAIMGFFIGQILICDYGIMISVNPIHERKLIRIA